MKRQEINFKIARSSEGIYVKIILGLVYFLLAPLVLSMLYESLFASAWNLPTFNYWQYLGMWLGYRMLTSRTVTLFNDIAGDWLRIEIKDDD